MKKVFPDAQPPLKQMTADQDAALARIQGATSFGKSHYQFGGEPEAIELRQPCFLS